MNLARNPRSLVFYLAYPGPGNLDGATRSLIDSQYLLNGLDATLADDSLSCIELTSLKVKTIRKQVIDRVKSSNKKVAFHCEPVQWVNEEALIDPADISSSDEVQRRRAIDRIIRLLDEAAEFGAEQVFVASGRNPASGQPYDQDSDRVLRQAIQGLSNSLRVLAKEAKSRNQQLAVALCDAGSPDEGLYRNQLLGPASRAIEVMEPLRAEGLDNLGISIDQGRLCLNGEGPETIPELAPYLQWVHFSNCVQSQGDTRARFDAPGSMIDGKDREAFCRQLAEVGYEGPLGIAVQPKESEVPKRIVTVAQAMVEQAMDSLDVAYAIPLRFAYRTRDFLNEETFATITDLRVQHPNLIREELTHRMRRDTLAPNGRLVILAADHPARSVTNVGAHPTAMGHRLDYLGRILRVLTTSSIDGLMATSDLIDEVVLANYLIKKRGGQDFLKNKVLIGSINRTGLAQTEHEMLDRPSSYMSARRLKELCIDGGKILWRWVPGGESKDRYALDTMERMAKTVDEMAELGIPAFVEPLPVIKTESGYKTDHTTDNIIKAVGIASAWGSYTGHVWLKIPYCADFARVAKSSTFPILLLGGESTGRPSGTIENFVRGMGAGPNIRGALVGRNVIFAGDEDPAVIAEAIHLVVHERASSIEAIERAKELRTKNLNLFT